MKVLGIYSCPSDDRIDVFELDLDKDTAILVYNDDQGFSIDNFKNVLSKVIKLYIDLEEGEERFDVIPDYELEEYLFLKTL